jgi:2-methylisocitrate lyase-like PEP mutase family enzyme
MQAIAQALPGVVLVANMIESGKTPLLTPSELHELGYDLIVSPLTGLFAMAKAVATAYAVLADQGTLRDHLDLVTGFDDFNRIVDLDRHYRLEARYQGTE